MPPLFRSLPRSSPRKWHSPSLEHHGRRILLRGRGAQLGMWLKRGNWSPRDRKNIICVSFPLRLASAVQKRRAHFSSASPPSPPPNCDGQLHARVVSHPPIKESFFLTKSPLLNPSKIPFPSHSKFWSGYRCNAFTRQFALLRVLAGPFRQTFRPCHTGVASLLGTKFFFFPNHVSMEIPPRAPLLAC